MKKLMYLLVAGTMFAFTACGEKTPAQESDDVKANEVVVEEAVEEVVEDTTAAEEAEATEETAE